MPATAFALRIEQAYGRRLAELWRQVAATVLRGFDGIAPDADLTPAFRRFLPIAEQTIILGQQQAQTLAAAFLAQYVEAEAERAYRPEPVAADIPGRTARGDRLSSALSQAVGVTWLGLRQGRQPREALGLARLYVGRIAGRSVSDAADREISHQAERSRGLLRGWTWVTVGDTCPGCLAAADGEVRPYPVRMSRHNGCDCSASPAIIGVPERIRRPTGEEIFRRMSEEQQAAIFKSAGAEKAALIRSGQATLRDFLDVERTAAGSMVHEAPLEAGASKG